MAVDNYPVSPLYWPSVRRKKWSESLTNLGLYLLTCRHRNLEGLYSLPYLYIASDLSWSMEKVQEMMQVVLEDGFVEYDMDAEVVLLPKALSFYAPRSDNQVKGAINALRLVPDTSLWGGFMYATKQHAPKLFEALGGDLELSKFIGPDVAEVTPFETPVSGHTGTHSEGLSEVK